MDIHSKLIHAATAYDTRNSARRGYNRFALAQYFMAIDEAVSLIDKGTEVNKALETVFEDRLLDVMKKAVQ